MVGIYFKTNHMPVRFLIYVGDHRADAAAGRRHRRAPQARLGHRDGAGRDPAARAGQPGGALRLGPLPRRPSADRPLSDAAAQLAVRPRRGRGGALRPRRARAPTSSSSSWRTSRRPSCGPRRARSPRKAFALWRQAGAVAAVRVNPLETCGREDLVGVLPARPDIVMMSKVGTPEQVRALEQATGGAVELVPNIETAAGLLRACDIARASPRVSAHAGRERGHGRRPRHRAQPRRRGARLRARALPASSAAPRGVEAIDCPYTFSDVEGRGGRRALRAAPRLPHEEPGRSVARRGDQPVLHARTSTRATRRIVAAFEKARAQGKERAKVDGALIEVPIYAAAKRLLESAARSDRGGEENHAKQRLRRTPGSATGRCSPQARITPSAK